VELKRPQRPDPKHDWFMWRYQSTIDFQTKYGWWSFVMAPILAIRDFLLSPFWSILWFTKASDWAITRLFAHFGIAFLGRSAVVAARSSICEVEFTQDNGGSLASITVRPKRLRFLNWQGREPRCTVLLERLPLGRVEGRMRLDQPSHFLAAQDSLHIRLRDVVPPSWMSADPAQWVVQVWAELGSFRALLYRGSPTSVRIAAPR
jgi:hypothetical protein